MSKNKWHIKGIDVAVPYLTPKAERVVIRERLEEALSLIEKYSPICMGNIRKDVNRILVSGNSTFHGQYVHKKKLIEIYETYVRNSDTTAEEISSIIVHEAQHARLFRLGFGYSEEVRERIERICFKSELNYGYRIPNGEKVISTAQNWLNSELKTRFSTYERQLDRIEALRKLGSPKWVLKILEMMVEHKNNKVS